MMDQLDLFDVNAARSAEPSTIDERFTAFDRAHPEVFRELVWLADQDVRAGVRRIGVKALWERMRGRIKTNGDGGYSLNNSLTSLYARKLAASDPRFAAVIELRERRTAARRG